MLVFGDHSYQERGSVFAGRLRARLRSNNCNDLDALRTLLIQAGQLEQAVADYAASSPETKPAHEHAERATDKASIAFCNNWFGANRASKNADTRESLSEFASALQTVAVPGDPLLEFKIPEGFAIYALYPEQYCLSVSKWLRQRQPSSGTNILVVGIRSIGTTLSAVCLATLRARGHRATRVTVRPGGSPWSRKLDFNWPERQGQIAALIVDEGPGLSGSTMAAVAQSLFDAGIKDISFLPGHDGEPGHAASELVRSWWAQTPKFYSKVSEVTWNGFHLETALARATFDSALETSIVDLSGGRWRKVVYPYESAWPAVAARFEPMKFLVSELEHEQNRTLNAGAARMLWKFSGVGCALENGETPVERILRRSGALADQGISVEGPVHVNGFLGQHWIQGERLTRLSASDSTILFAIAGYILKGAGPPQTNGQRQSGVAQLSEMLYWNTREAIGEELADQSIVWSDAARNCDLGLTYGDGRMEPHEWVRSTKGDLIKPNCCGRACDHTLIGVQSLLWDVAALLCEWDLGQHQLGQIISFLLDHNLRFDPLALRFYCAAYAAFRLGLMNMCMADESEGSPERLRLERAANFYKAKLLRQDLFEQGVRD